MIKKTNSISDLRFGKRNRARYWRGYLHKLNHISRRWTRSFVNGNSIWLRRWMSTSTKSKFEYFITCNGFLIVMIDLKAGYTCHHFVQIWSSKRCKGKTGWPNHQSDRRCQVHSAYTRNGGFGRDSQDETRCLFGLGVRDWWCHRNGRIQLW